MSGFRLRHPRLWVAVLVSLLVLIVFFFLLRIFEEESPHLTDHPDYPYAVKTLDDQGREHIPSGRTFDGYNSNPPTSGPHGPVADWGVHTDHVPKEQAVHNMEHGGVIVWYNCDRGSQPLSESGCADLRDRLAAVVKPEADRGLYVLLTAYGEMDSQIALTAWRNLDAFDDFDEARVRAFIASFECRFNPEGLC